LVEVVIGVFEVVGGGKGELPGFCLHNSMVVVHLDLLGREFLIELVFSLRHPIKIS
jgi:hypothetical protein